MRRIVFLLALAGLAGGIAAAVAVIRGGSVSPEAAVARAAARTADAGTSRIEITGRDESGEGFLLAGVLDYVKGNVRLTIDFSGVPAEERDLLPAELLVISDILYVKMPGLARKAGSSRTWTRMSFSGDDDPLGSLLWRRFVDPVRLLGYLQSVSDVSEVGTEVVRDVKTRRFRGTLELERVIEHEPTPLREKLRKELKTAERTTLPVDVWVDGDGLARRLRMADFQTESADPASFDFFDFGVDAQIEPPPADQVTDLAELLKGASAY